MVSTVDLIARITLVVVARRRARAAVGAAPASGAVAPIRRASRTPADQRRPGPPGRTGSRARSTGAASGSAERRLIRPRLPGCSRIAPIEYPCSVGSDDPLVAHAVEQHRREHQLQVRRVQTRRRLRTNAPACPMLEASGPRSPQQVVGQSAWAGGRRSGWSARPIASRPGPSGGPAGSVRRRAGRPGPSMPCRRRSPASPMPEASSRAGVFTAPPHSTTSPVARACSA